MEEYVGKTFGTYKILELIGKGGMAAVYRAHQPSLNRDVAIKIMAGRLTEDETFTKRFINEARVIAKLDHAHILPVHDFGEQDGVPYIVMRYLPTGTLSDRIPKEGMSLDEVARIISQLASALDYAHSQGIIHRDLKPSNVMLDAQGNVFLTDFGIAKSLEGGQTLTATDSVVGTPNYMSPEQGLGDQVDARSDVYSLGVMLFEMLTGRQPFEADTPMAVMLKHIQQPPPAPSVMRPDIPPQIDAVVLKALEKDKTVRYQSAGELAKALERAVAASKSGATAVAPGTLPVGAVSPTVAGVAATVPAYPPAQPATPTGPAASGAPAPSPMPTTAGAAAPPHPATAAHAAAAAPPVPVEIGKVDIRLNAISAWLAKNQVIGVWLQAVGLSLATFLILARLTQGGRLEIALLSLIPGIFIYGLLRAPTLGALSSFILILPPLLAHAPGLGLVWLAVTIVAGARLNSREIMLTLVGLVLAWTPFGWLIPLLMPWWLRARRTVLPSAMAVGLATLFAATLGWPNAGGLLPVPAQIAPELVTLGPFERSYLGLFELGAWRAWGQIDALIANLIGTLNMLGRLFAESNGLPLFVSVAWALAATLTVSNQRVQSPIWRTMGMVLAVSVLLVAHLRPRPEGMVEVSPLAVILALFSAVLAFALSQWPIQADPNAGNKTGTVLRLLRQSLGALFVALGLAFFGQLLSEAPFYPVLWVGGSFGALALIVNPLAGALIAFASVTAGLFQFKPALTITTAVLLFAYLLVNLLFDRRRPRRWNPLGAGLILGAPGMAGAGLLTLGPLSIGALEAQVPAALLAMMAHVTLIATTGTAKPINIIVQLLLTVAGVLVVERLMGLEILTNLPHKLRRLIFTVPLALLMALGYYTLGGLKMVGGSLLGALGLSLLTAAGLVVAMGDRAMYWRRFVEYEEEEEDIAEDEEVTGEHLTARKRK